jgi:hypothetical protein
MAIIIGLIVGIACGLFIIGDAKKRNMSAGWSVLGFLLALLGLLIYIIARKPIADQTVTNYKTDSNNFSIIPNQQVIIPDSCPHCKNPNTKRIRLCEWCGSQIC